VIAAVQNHLCLVPVLLYVENNLYLNYLGIIEVKRRHLPAAVFFHSFSHADVSSGHPDGWICIFYLHIAPSYG